MEGLPWIVLGALVAGLLTLDLFVLHRIGGDHESFRRAIIESVLWLSVGIGFTGVAALFGGKTWAIDYLTAFIIEKSLSADNLFVFAVLFDYFDIPRERQRRVLMYGIIGAVVMRGLFVLAGIALIERFSWLLYVLGASLLLAGIRLGVQTAKHAEAHPEQNFVVRWVGKVLPIWRDYHGPHFLVRKQGKLWFTPLFLALLAVEISDIIFAIDSVPAVLAVTQDRFIAYSSNIFAVLGLRALYFLLAGALQRLPLLHYALALILSLVGVKMLLHDAVHIPSWVSLTVVLSILVLATVVALLGERRQRALREAPANI